MPLARRRFTFTRCFGVAWFAFSIFTLYIAVLKLPTEPCNCDGKIPKNVRCLTLEEEAHRMQDDQKIEYELRGDDPSWGEHKLCLLVPFKDRFEELMEFVPHMHKYLNNQKIRHKILIIDQIDRLRFNRASLINLGFLQAEAEGCDYVGMHDVDLMPLNPNLNYSYPHKGPFHIAAPHLHPKYHYRTFVGGILLIKNAHFRKVNGLSNRYWGWGREDDEFYVRMVEAEFTIFRPHNITTGLDTFKHFHTKERRPRDYKRYGAQKRMDSKRDRFSGLNNVRFDIMASEEIKIENAPAQIIRVELFCDLKVTPWCVHPDQLDSMLAAAHKAQKAAEEEVNAARNQMQVAQNQMKAAQQQMHNANQDLKPLNGPKWKEKEGSKKNIIGLDQHKKHQNNTNIKNNNQVRQQVFVR